MNRSIIAAVTLSICASNFAHAADVIVVETSTPGIIPVHDTETAFDWTGFYAGVYGAARIGSVATPAVGIGIQAGVNAQFDFLLIGGEVSVEGLSGDVGDTLHGQILGRAGLVATDEVVVYAAGGYGMDLDEDSAGEAVIGAGVEVAVTQDISLEARYLHSFPIQAEESSDTITFGANFHF